MDVLGYNFKSLEQIIPFLEPTASGISTQWAQRTAHRLQCTVVVGYPEVAQSPLSDVQLENARPEEQNGFTSFSRPVIPNHDPSFPHNYNASVVVDAAGAVRAHYRKSHLYYTDATWAREGQGFQATEIPLGKASASGQDAVRCTATLGICMDLNNKNFTAPWTAWEFANHVLDSKSRLAIVSMAWLSAELSEEQLIADPKVSDLHTVSYWAARLQPVIERAGMGRPPVIAVLANRAGVEGEACYAGSSTVMLLGGGETRIFDLLGKGEERLLVVDTDNVSRDQGMPSCKELQLTCSAGFQIPSGKERAVIALIKHRLKAALFGVFWCACH